MHYHIYISNYLNFKTGDQLHFSLKNCMRFYQYSVNTYVSTVFCVNKNVRNIFKFQMVITQNYSNRFLIFLYKITITYFSFITFAVLSQRKTISKISV